MRSAGFVMTITLFGTIGGFNLMYPTIAVEGSDSFDAITRSFSYVYARPWRMLFYTLAGRCLRRDHVHLRAAVPFPDARADRTTLSAGGYSEDADNYQPLWPEMWRSPDFMNLPYWPDFSCLAPVTGLVHG